MFKFLPRPRALQMKIKSRIQVPQTFRRDSSIQVHHNHLYKRGQSSQTEEGNYENLPGTVFANHRLKPLKVPSFGGDKIKVEDLWGLFESLVDKSKKTS